MPAIEGGTTKVWEQLWSGGHLLLPQSSPQCVVMDSVAALHTGAQGACADGVHFSGFSSGSRPIEGEHILGENASDSYPLPPSIPLPISSYS